MSKKEVGKQIYSGYQKLKELGDLDRNAGEMVLPEIAEQPTFASKVGVPTRTRNEKMEFNKVAAVTAASFIVIPEDAEAGPLAEAIHISKRLLDLGFLKQDKADSPRAVKSAETRYRNAMRNNPGFADRERRAYAGDYQTVFVPKDVPPEQVADPESLVGKVITPVRGDQSDTGTIKKVGGIDVDVDVEGGHKFTREYGGWASSAPVARAQHTKHQQAAEDTGREVVGVYNAMGFESTNFSTPIAETMMQQIPELRFLPKSDINLFDNELRNLQVPAGSGKKPYKDWVGLDHPDAMNQLVGREGYPRFGKLRTAFSTVMGKSKYRDKGFPAYEEVLRAANDPELAGVEIGTSGKSMYAVDTSKQVAPFDKHASYDAQMPGQYIGGLSEQVPFEVMFPKSFQRFTSTPTKAGKMQTPDQAIVATNIRKDGYEIADQQWLDGLMSFLEGQKKGSSKNKSVVNGVVGLMAAGYLAAPEEADAGVLSSLAKLSKQGYDTKRVYYHGTSDDITAIDPSKFSSQDSGFIGQGFYVSSEPRIASSYANTRSPTTRQDDGTFAGPNVVPVYIKTKKTKQYTLLEKQEMGMQARQDPDFSRKLTEQLKSEGFDSAEVLDGSGAVVEKVIFDPTAIRSVNAAGVDSSSRNLLASAGGVTATGAAILQAERTYASDIEPTMLQDQVELRKGSMARLNGTFVEPQTLKEKLDNYDYEYNFVSGQQYRDYELGRAAAGQIITPIIGKTIAAIPGVVGQVGAGVAEGIQEFDKTIEDMDRGLYNLFGLDYDATQEAIKDTNLDGFDPLGKAADFAALYEAGVGQPENIPEEVAKLGGQFFGSFKLFSKALQGLGWAKPGMWRNVTAEALAGATMFDPFEEQFAGVLQELGIENEFVDWVAARDSAAEGRLKNALDIAVSGAAIEGGTKIAGTAFDKLINTKPGRAILATMGGIYAARKGVKELTGKQTALEEVDIQRQKYEVLKESAGDPNGPSYNMGANNIDEVEINFSTLETGDDVKQLIQELADSDIEEINKARRGEVGWDQTRMEADKINAFDVLANRRVGEPLNAAQTVAVRELWAKSGRRAADLAKEVALDPSPMNMIAYKRQLVVHETIQREVMGARAETARALNAWRMPVNDREMSVLIEQLGNEDNIEAIAKRHMALTEAGSADQVETFVNGTAWAKTSDAVASAWYFALLSSPKTHIRNVSGNSLSTMLRPAELALAARMPGAESIKRGESMATLFGMMNGLARALRYSKENEKMGTVWQSMSTGSSGFGIGKVDQPMIGGFDPEKLNATPGTVPYYLSWGANALTQLPGRMLTAGDELFKTMNYDMEIHRLAFKEVDEMVSSGQIPEYQRQYELDRLINDPEDYMRFQAQAMAQRQTFTDMPESTPYYKAWKNISNLPVLGKIIAPFQKTPYNIGLYSFERTPMAPVVKRYRDNLEAGGERAEMAIAQQVMGTTMMLTAADLTMSGHLTGNGPSDPQDRSEWLKTHQPYSIRWQDPDTGEWEHVSYRGLEPIGTLINLGATLTEILQDTEDEEIDINLEKTIIATTMAVGSAMTVQSYMQGMADFFEVMNDPYKGNAERYVQRLTGSFLVPAVVRDVAYIQDPVMRHASSMLEGVKARTPGMTQDLPARRDRFGNIKTRASDMGPVYDAVVPFYKVTKEEQPIDAEMTRLGMNFRLPQGQQNFNIKPGFSQFGSVKVKLKEKHPAAYYRFVELYGQEVKENQFGQPISTSSGYRSQGGSLQEELNAVVTGEHPFSFFYNRGTDGEEGTKVRYIRSIINAHKTEAKRRLVEEYPEIQREIDKRVK